MARARLLDDIVDLADSQAAATAVAELAEETGGLNGVFTAAGIDGSNRPDPPGSAHRSSTTRVWWPRTPK